MKASISLILFIVLSTFLITGCTINQKKRFEKVQVGMDKDQVLDLLASPQRAERWHGADRWTYTFYEDDIRYDKEIHFTEGKALYVGDPYKPEFSAEERDKKNEQANAEAEKIYQSKRQESRQAYDEYQGDPDATASPNQSPRYVPEFKPIQ